MALSVHAYNADSTLPVPARLETDYYFRKSQLA